VYFKRRKETFGLLLGEGNSSNISSNHHEKPFGLKKLDWTNENHR